jgi:hypothetical protein
MIQKEAIWKAVNNNDTNAGRIAYLVHLDMAFHH